MLNVDARSFVDVLPQVFYVPTKQNSIHGNALGCLSATTATSISGDELTASHAAICDRQTAADFAIRWNSCHVFFSFLAQDHSGSIAEKSRPDATPSKRDCVLGDAKPFILEIRRTDYL